MNEHQKAQLEEILSEFRNGANQELNIFPAFRGKVQLDLHQKETFLAIQALFESAIHEAREGLADRLKVAIRADYERLAYDVMRKDQFRFDEETYGYRTIDQVLAQLQPPKENKK